jgi:hypothetical protein
MLGRRKEIQVSAAALERTWPDSRRLPREVGPAGDISDGRARLLDNGVGTEKGSAPWQEVVEEAMAPSKGGRVNKRHRLKIEASAFAVWKKNQAARVETPAPSRPIHFSQKFGPF